MILACSIDLFSIRGTMKFLKQCWMLCCLLVLSSCHKQPTSKIVSVESLSQLKTDCQPVDKQTLVGFNVDETFSLNNIFKDIRPDDRTIFSNRMVHKQFMEKAIALALENIATSKGGPFGAVIVKNNEIIAQGVNLVTATNDPTAHAEIVAIRNACTKLTSFQLKGCTLYTTCEPCPMCLGAIYWSRCDAVFYGATKVDAAAVGFDDSFIYEQITVPPELRTIKMLQIEHVQAQKVLAEWVKSSKKIAY